MKVGRVFICLIVGMPMQFRLLAEDSTFVSAKSSLGSALVWDQASKMVSVPYGADLAQLTFACTNISTGDITITNVRPSCGCTTAKLPELPWTIAPGSSGNIDVKINIKGKEGKLFKAITVGTDKGAQRLEADVNILTLQTTELSITRREANMKMASVDRQAVFKGDCTSCHVKPAEGKYGRELYKAVCGICHDSSDRASMVPDLHSLRHPTSLDFWRTWAEHGKPGTLMPAFSMTDGGPLTDAQIATIATYLDAAIPSQ